MKKFLSVILALTALSGIACSSTKYPPDPSLTRNKAHSAYSDLDQETGSPHVNQKNVRNGDLDVYSRQKSESSAMAFSDINTPTIMVMPSQSRKGKTSLEVINGNPMSKAMMEAINGYLTQKHFEVKSLEGEAQLNNVIAMQNDIANSDEDLSYLASLALGADIYLKFSGSVHTDNVVVEVSAYETSTARLLGSQTAEVKNNGHTDQTHLRANVQSAARKAMPNLVSKILAYWKTDLEKGMQYKVVMNLKGDYTDRQIEDLQDNVVHKLKNTFNSVTVNIMTEKTLDMVIYADPVKFGDSQEVYSTIRKILRNDTETKKINITRKLILMELL